MRVSSSRSSEMRLHLNRAGTRRIVTRFGCSSLDFFYANAQLPKRKAASITSRLIKLNRFANGLCSLTLSHDLLLIENHRRVRRAARAFAMTHHSQGLAIA